LECGGNHLLVFKPIVLERRDSLFLTEPQRKTPVRLESYSFSETIRIQFPEGYQVDVTPEAIRIARSFGSYQIDFQRRDKEILVRRSMIVRRSTTPIDKYTEVRTFFEQIRNMEKAPIVLLKK